ncbi:MAG: hexitol phosphatase HxpB [Bacteroidales bacterium]|nr:hexitol phosphatase HxpB [Bacteroidales bacterium]
MIKAVIFDMDGVIINSEPYWREAEMDVFNKIGVQMTEEMCIEMKGTKIDEVVKHWYSVYPWNGPTLKEVEVKIIDKVNSLVNEKGEPMTGLMGLLEYLKSNNIKIGLATSSLFSIMDVVLDKLKIRDYFDVTHSAEAEKAGKPAPDVYLGAALKLRVSPADCIAIEDSYTGLLSAQAAGMFTIALPELHEYGLEKYDIADIKIKSLKEVIQLDVISKFLTVS